MTTNFIALGSYKVSPDIQVKKYQSTTGLTVYFAHMVSPVTHGYFCFAIDDPEAFTIETLIGESDTSGLDETLPEEMRFRSILPARQFYGHEEPLVDRDQSCYICRAFGWEAFKSSFEVSAQVLLKTPQVRTVLGKHEMTDSDATVPTKLQRLETLNQRPLSSEEYLQAYVDTILDDKTGSVNSATETPHHQVCRLSSEDELDFLGKELLLESMFPGSRAFSNRRKSLLKKEADQQVLDCFRSFYRPENLTVIVIGTILNELSIFKILQKYENDYVMANPNPPAYRKPWSTPLPEQWRFHQSNATTHFTSCIPGRDLGTTVFLGWRGCPSSDWETTIALRALTAYLVHGPLFKEFVQTNEVLSITWSQLEYSETIFIIKVGGIQIKDDVDPIIKQVGKIIALHTEAAKLNHKILTGTALPSVKEQRVAESECRPLFSLAGAICKANRYSDGGKIQVGLRYDLLQEHPDFPQEHESCQLKNKGIDYWTALVQKYFVDSEPYITILVPQPEELVESSRTLPGHDSIKSAAIGIGLGRCISNKTLSEALHPPLLSRKKYWPINDGGEDFESCYNRTKCDEECASALQRNLTPFGEHVGKTLIQTWLAQAGKIVQQANDFTPANLEVQTYESKYSEDHPYFKLSPLLPVYTFLVEIPAKLIYLTLIIDASHLSAERRKLIIPFTEALSNFLHPRPVHSPYDVVESVRRPAHSNPPCKIVCSSVSDSLLGETMQKILISVGLHPASYTLAPRFFNYFLRELKFKASHLQLAANNALKKILTQSNVCRIEDSYYEYLEAAEINLHGLIRLVYKPESNAGVYVTRKRLNFLTEYLNHIENYPEDCEKVTNEAWDDLVDRGHTTLQIAGNISTIPRPKHIYDLASFWQKFEKPHCDFSNVPFSTQKHMMNEYPGVPGFLFTVNYRRPSCISIALRIDPNDDYYDKLRFTCKLFSLAPKWAWKCFDKHGEPTPVITIQNPFTNLLIFTLESFDILGAMHRAKKSIKRTCWKWLDEMIVVTKLTLMKEPPAIDNGAKGKIERILVAQLNNQEWATKTDQFQEMLKITAADVKFIIYEYFPKFFRHYSCWYSLVTNREDKDNLVKGLGGWGYTFVEADIKMICSNL